MNVFPIPNRVLLAATAALSLVLAGCGDGESNRQSYLKKAQELYEAGDFEKARLEYRNAVGIEPRDADSRYRLGLTFERLERWQEAYKQFGLAAELDEKHLEARVSMSKLLIAGRSYDLAGQRIDEVLALDPTHPAALALRSRLLMTDG